MPALECSHFKCPLLSFQVARYTGNQPVTKYPSLLSLSWPPADQFPRAIRSLPARAGSSPALHR